MKRVSVAVVAMATCLIAGGAVAADATMRGLVTQAKAVGPVRVLDPRLGEVDGQLTDTAGDVFCVQVKLDSDKGVEYCFAYEAVDLVVKPGTGAHRDFTAIWIRGARR